jgi:hypothetical protein
MADEKEKGVRRRVEEAPFRFVINRFVGNHPTYSDNSVKKEDDGRRPLRKFSDQSDPS